MFRQGDVLVIPCKTIPKKAKKIAENHVILAYGEATGHTHAITSQAAALLQYGDEKLGSVETYLRLKESASLQHQEHEAIELPAGNYRVIRQREYSPAEIRYVAD